LHKICWSGCKRFTSGHGIAGTVAGIEAAIYCGDKLWFGVGMERRSINDIAKRTLSTVKSTLKQRQRQWYNDKATPGFSISFPFCDERCRNSVNPFIAFKERSSNT